MTEETVQPQPDPDLQGLLVGLVVEGLKSRIGKDHVYTLNCVLRTPEHETKHVTLWVEGEKFPEMIGTLIQVLVTMVLEGDSRVKKQQLN